MSILDYFVGATQSKYAAIAIFAAVIVLCIAIFVINTDIPLSNRISMVFFTIIMSVFPVMISLFELNCIVTGAKGNLFNPCNIFAWFISIVIIIYCIILIISVFMSVLSYKTALKKVSDVPSQISKEDADIIAVNIIKEHYADKNDETPEHLMPKVPSVQSISMNEPQSIDDVDSKLAVFPMKMPENNMNILQKETTTQQDLIQKFVDKEQDYNGFDSGDIYMEYSTKKEIKEPKIITPKFTDNKSHPEPYTTTLEKFSSI